LVTVAESARDGAVRVFELLHQARPVIGDARFESVVHQRDRQLRLSDAAANRGPTASITLAEPQLRNML
jgi:hypothetical protein